MKRMKFFSFTAALSLVTLIGLSLNAQTPEKTYAQYLIDQALARHPDVLVLMMHVTAPKETDNVVIASNIGRLGKKADDDDLAVIKTGVPKLEVNKTGDHFEVELPLTDASQRRIGALGVVFPYKAGDDQAKRQKQAEQIRDELARRISHVENLVEAARFDSTTPIGTYAQHLVDQTLEKYPELVIMVMHVTPPSGSDTDNVILGSSIGRIGKKADEDDLRVVRTGKTNLEVNSTGERFEVELVLQDVAGNTVGALGLVFPYKAGDDKAAFQKKAEKIRNELRRRITNNANLFEPYPFDPKYPTSTYGQHLIDEALAQNPDVLILAIHVTPPEGKDNVIVASNIGRIGKKADADDYEVIKAGVTHLDFNPAGDRLSVYPMLHDVAGNKIGSLGVVFPYQAGDDKAAHQKQAEQIRDRLARRITNVANLLEPYPFDLNYSPNTYAQKLVDETLAKHPEVLVLAIHAKPAGSGKSVILGSNIGRHGKEDSEDDLSVLRTGKSFLQLKDSGDRYLNIVVLHDASGKAIGSLAVNFPYKASDDKRKLQQRASQIQDEMRKKIPSLAKLSEPAQ